MNSCRSIALAFFVIVASCALTVIKNFLNDGGDATTNSTNEMEVGRFIVGDDDDTWGGLRGHRCMKRHYKMTPHAQLKLPGASISI